MDAMKITASCVHRFGLVEPSVGLRIRSLMSCEDSGFGGNPRIVSEEVLLHLRGRARLRQVAA
ncbi:MAG: hypothetical protein A2Z17_01020 [Gammaproteobacteria bacterium RBG_16_66_13]|nr:MAG: hypothetical protein A2Z17_01020 [Gammaproteobacteria bacterium RBG_16_66_13]